MLLQGSGDDMSPSGAVLVPVDTLSSVRAAYAGIAGVGVDASTLRRAELRLCTLLQWRVQVSPPYIYPSCPWYLM